MNGCPIIVAFAQCSQTYCTLCSNGKCSCMYDFRPALNSCTVCPLARSIHLVVNNPSTPTGPLAWIRVVLMPTSAPITYYYITIASEVSSLTS